MRRNIATTSESSAMPDELASGVESQSLEEAGSKRATRSKPRKTRERSRRKPDTYAALDLGTNNCRLLIARPAKQGFYVVDSFSKVVRLGSGLSSTGRLSEESMSAAIDAIIQCSKKMGQKRVKRWRCVATQACRQASNGKEFLGRVKSETGLNLELISARVEARLSVMGCLNIIDLSKDVALVIDIGGGSTELSWVDIRRLRDSLKDKDKSFRIHRPPISAWASLPLGVVTLSEQVPESPDLEARYNDMKKAVKDAIAHSGCMNRFTKAFKMGKGHLIGTSGTITSLAAVHLKLPFYQRDRIDGLWIKRETAVDIARKMSLISTEERAKEPSIGTDRASLLVAGCAIMDVVCEMWPSENIRVADRGLREGMLMGMMQQSRKFNFKFEKEQQNKKTSTPKINTEGQDANE